MTGLKKNWRSESFGAVGMRRSRREAIEFTAAMRAAGTGPVELVLPVNAVERGGSPSHESDRREVHAVAVLRNDKWPHSTCVSTLRTDNLNDFGYYFLYLVRGQHTSTV